MKIESIISNGGEGVMLFILSNGERIALQTQPGDPTWVVDQLARALSHPDSLKLQRVEADQIVTVAQ